MNADMSLGALCHLAHPRPLFPNVKLRLGRRGGLTAHYMNTDIMSGGGCLLIIQVLNSLCPFPNVKPTGGSPSRLSRQLAGTLGDTTRARASSLSLTATTLI